MKSKLVITSVLVIVMLQITGCLGSLSYIVFENHRQEEIRISGYWGNTIWIPACSAVYPSIPGVNISELKKIKVEYSYGIIVPSSNIDININKNEHLVKVIILPDSKDICSQEVIGKSSIILHNKSTCIIDITFEDGTQKSLEPLDTLEYGPVSGDIWTTFDNLKYACRGNSDRPILPSGDIGRWKLGDIPTLERNLIPLR